MLKENPLIKPGESFHEYFTRQKRMTDTFLKSENSIRIQLARKWLDYWKKEGRAHFEGGIDEKILDIVMKMNSLPFLSTESSCEGHIETREWLEKRYPHSKNLPSPGKVRYFNGFINFYLDRSEQSKNFFDGLKSIIQEHKEASLHKYKKMDAPFQLIFGKIVKSGSDRYPIIDEETAKKMAEQEAIFRKKLEEYVDEFIKIFKESTSEKAQVESAPDRALAMHRPRRPKI